MRLMFLDTETTGLNRKGDVSNGHRIIELACVEMEGGELTGRKFHRYINPEMKVSPPAIKVHGITDSFLSDKPRFSDIVSEFIDFIGNSDIVIHNAPFDVSFLDKEFTMLPIEQRPKGKKFKIIDSLVISRRLFPGGDNTLEGLCERFGIEQTKKHNALMDAIHLSKVFKQLLRSM